MDALRSGRVTLLLMDGKITREIATSLVNDSERAGRIMQNLIDSALKSFCQRWVDKNKLTTLNKHRKQNNEVLRGTTCLFG